MKVYIVFAGMGYRPEFLDLVYADEADAQRRVGEINQGIDNFRSWWESNTSREFERAHGALEALWAAETGNEHLGDLIPLISDIDPAHYEEREIL